MFKSKIKLLVVDDEEPIIFVLRQILETEGYHITAYHSAKEALQNFHRGSFQVVITDVRMSGMDGVTMLSEMRKIDPELQFVIFTAYGVGGDQPEMAINIGTCAFLYKPFEKKELLNAIHRAVSHYFARAHYQPIVEATSSEPVIWES